LLVIPTVLSIADGKIKYPIAEAAKGKTTKVTIALLTCSFAIGYSIALLPLLEIPKANDL